MARHPEQSSEETAREATRKAADQTARSGEVMSDSAERAMRSGAETAERNSERLLGSWRNGTDAANRIAERSLSQFVSMFGFSGEHATRTLQQSSGNLQALFETTTIITGGLQDLSGELTRFIQDRAERHLELVDKAMACRGPLELVNLQTQIARDHIEAFLQAAKKTSERTVQMADQAARRIAEAGQAA